MALELPTGREYRLLVDEIRGRLDDEDRDRLDGWIADPSVSADRIASALSAAGHPCSRAAVYAWRRRVS